MGDQVSSSIKVVKVKAPVPNPLPDNYLEVGFDESGRFPSRHRMIMYAAMSNNPADGFWFRDSMTRSSYTRNTESFGLYGGIWTELNGVHSQVPELRANAMLTRMIGAAYLISPECAGYDGSKRTHAWIDQFWPDSDHETFHTVLKYFGITPDDGTLSVLTKSDKRVPIVTEAHAQSRMLRMGSRQNRDSDGRRVEIPPDLIIDCMMHLAKQHCIGIDRMPETSIYEKAFSFPPAIQELVN